MPYNCDFMFLMPDIDECATGLNDCAFNLICHNSNGSYNCGSRSEPIIETIQRGKKVSKL